MAQSSGSPGSAMSVKIRGNSSNGKNDPLYIVDGMKTSSIDFLSPNDIESIEILKDAASSAIYGSEGGNGVVIVSTKRAKEGASEINYNYYHGVQVVSNYVKMMDAKEYIDYQRDAYESEKILKTHADSTVKYPAKLKYYDSWDSAATNTNWMDEIINNAPVDEHNISFASATEKGKMFLSASYYSQDGIIGGDKNNFTRYSFHFSGESKVKDWLTVGSDVSYSKSEKNNLNESSEFGGIISNAIFFDPTIPVYYNDTSELPASIKPDLTVIGGTDRFNALVKNDDGKYYHLSTVTTKESNNPLAQIHNTHNVTTSDKILADIHSEIAFNKSLKFTTKLSLDYALGYDNIFTPKSYYDEDILKYNDTSNVTIENSFEKRYKYALENYATYINTFGDNSIELMAGMSYEKFVPNYLDVTSFHVPHNDAGLAYLYNTINTSATSIPIVNGGVGTINNNDPSGQIIVNNCVEIQNSYFGRAVYNYKEKYMLQGNIRRDGSSMFPSKYLYGTFPSFSLGWNIGKEDFFADNISFINSMKIRFSWGQNGNKQILRPFLYTSAMSTNVYYPNSTGTPISGAVPDNPGNPDLHWETSQQSDFGVEIAMLKNKLVISADYFDKRTKDQLAQNSQVPIYLGYTTIPFANTGEVQNKGVECDITYREQESEFKYAVSFNASYLKNEVLSYGAEGAFKDGLKIGIADAVTRYEAGQPVYYFKGYKALGIFQDTSEVSTYVNSSGVKIQPKAIPGDVKYEDSNGDGQITGSDNTNYLGKPMPDWTFGLNLSCQYKGFDLSALFQGVTGNQIIFAALRYDAPMFNKPEFYYTDRWTGPNSTNKYPRASVNSGNAFKGNSSSNFLWSNINVYDGDYLRLKNITLGYTLPKELTGKIGISKFRLYFTATNLLTFTNYPGSDPEIGQVVASDPSTYGIDRGLYPSSKTFTGGINVTF
jgi:TonB-dependent starch-binding outer membrane protein SusC